MKPVHSELFVNPKFPIKLFDENQNLIYYEIEDGNWAFRQYDLDKNVIFFSNSYDGIIFDKFNSEES